MFFTPTVVPVTLTVIMQEPPLAIAPPVKAIVPEPAVAVTMPPHAPVKPLGEATTKPAGKVSVKLTPVRPTVLAAGLVRVKVKLVVPLSAMLGAPKALTIIGGATTLKGAVTSVPFVPPSVEVIESMVLV